MEHSRWFINKPISLPGRPLAAFAVHQGHRVRSELTGLLAINEDQRLREEDPFTGRLAEVVETHVIVDVSRFEVDFNRPRQNAVYRKPEDAWGLNIWKKDVPGEIVTSSLNLYDRFYEDVYELLKKMGNDYGRFIVIDLHSYCHRRNGPDEPADPADKNPDINVGTGALNRQLWSNIVDRFIADMSSRKVSGRHLDVRENIRFRGGYLSKWINETFPRTGCCLAVEVKKIFMDEWSGKLDEKVFKQIINAFEFALPGLIEEL